MLWTNPSPTSQDAGQTINCSSIDGYRFVKFYYRFSTSENTEYSILIPVEEARKARGEARNYSGSYEYCSYILCGVNMSTGSTTTSVSPQIRRITYVSDTSFKTYTNYSNQAANNNYVILTKICGVN